MDGYRQIRIHTCTGNFWNSWAVLRNDIKLIVCGSATSWMINNLIRNRGGLHNRLTHHLIVKPFTLHECEEYFKAYHFGYSRKQIAECYMIMGGIPYYLSMMDKSKVWHRTSISCFRRQCRTER